jgi:WD40 repeat protein
VSGSCDKLIRIWNRDTKKHIIVGSHTDRVYSVALSIDNRFIVSGSADKTVKLWDL